MYYWADGAEKRIIGVASQEEDVEDIIRQGVAEFHKDAVSECDSLEAYMRENEDLIRDDFRRETYYDGYYCG